MRKWSFFLVFAFFGAVADAEDQAPGPSLFPIKGDHQDGLAEEQAAAYSRGLRALNEESLMSLAKEEQAEVYRLTVISGWDGTYEVVKLVKKNGGYSITHLRGDRPRVQVPGRVLENQTAVLSQEEAADFGNVFKASAFFELPFRSDSWMDDGYVFLLEAVKDGHYHGAMRWPPDLDGSWQAYAAVCDWLLENAPKDEAAEERRRKAWEQLSSEEKSLNWDQHWPPDALTNLGETALSPLAKDATAEVYRLVIQPSFNFPMAVTLIKTGDSWRIIHRGSDASPKMFPRKPASDLSEEMPSEQAAEFRKLFDAFSRTKKPDTGGGGFDREDWILESVRDGQYHADKRWSPSSDAEERGLLAFLDCGQWLKNHAPTDQALKK